jgi:hypothetical protein
MHVASLGSVKLSMTIQENQKSLVAIDSKNQKLEFFLKTQVHPILTAQAKKMASIQTKLNKF